MTDNANPSLTIVTIRPGAEGLEDYAVIDPEILPTPLPESVTTEISATCDAIDLPPGELAWHAAADLPIGVQIVRQVREGPRFLVLFSRATQADGLASAANVHARHTISEEGWTP